MKKIVKLTLLLLSVSGSIAYSQTLVDTELSLVVDISGSVNSVEYQQQMEGYARSFEDNRLHTAISNGRFQKIATNLIFFDSRATVQIPFMLIDSPASSNAFASILRSETRPRAGGTSPNTGIDLATATLNSNAFEGTQKVIDVSGDGRGSASRDSQARDNALADGVDVINAIPIGGSIDLTNYYKENIIGGDSPFIIESSTFSDFEAAVLEKLTKEVSSPKVTPSVPEPSAIALLGLGAFGFVMRRKR